MIVKFLTALRLLVIAKNGGEENELSKLINLARLGVRAGDTGRQHLTRAVETVEKLVAEDRAMTDQELADLDVIIREKLQRAALTDPEAKAELEAAAADADAAADETEVSSTPAP